MAAAPAQLTEADGAVRRCPLASQPAYRQHIGLITVLTHEFKILFFKFRQFGFFT